MISECFPNSKRNFVFHSRSPWSPAPSSHSDWSPPLLWIVYLDATCTISTYLKSVIKLYFVTDFLIIMFSMFIHTASCNMYIFILHATKIFINSCKTLFFRIVFLWFSLFRNMPCIHKQSWQGKSSRLQIKIRSSAWIAGIWLLGPSTLPCLPARAPQETNEGLDIMVVKTLAFEVNG